MKNKVSSSSLEEEKSSLKAQAELCQSLTHPFRLKILRLLVEGRKNVRELMEATNKPQPFISQHLRVLREKEAVNSKRDGNEVFYSLADPKIVKICELVAELINERQR
ncbi:transcriptional regulator [Candidatus Heimdallarchaeota archaeon B3_Heim]|nr:MAG: transcriptional regulator [Candidatus Heimdallarchaeota archaeon B3_Heim]